MDDGLDILAKVYVKLYICQIFASVSYPSYKQGELEYKKILAEADLGSTQEGTQVQTPKESALDEDKYLKRFFVYKGKVFSKLEIMGVVTQIQTHSQTGSPRKILFIDDTTGVIQCILWKNKAQSFYDLSEKEISNGTYLRILGQVDFYANKFEINVERFQIVRSFIPESLFHITLYNNKKELEDSKIYHNLKVELGTSAKELSSTDNQNSLSNVNRQNSLKEFANKFLAFFQNYKISTATEDELGFTRISVKALFSNSTIKDMMKDFLGSNEKEQMKDLQEVIVTMFEQNMFGKIIYKDKEENNFAEADIEIKNDRKKITSEILEFIRKKCEEDPSKGAAFSEITKYLNSIYRNFFTSNSVRFLLIPLIDQVFIYNLTEYSYAITQ